MEPNFPNPAPAVPPAKGMSKAVIFSLAASAIISFWCFCCSIPVFLGTASYTINGVRTEVPGIYGLCCVGVGLIPWIITLIIAILKHQKIKISIGSD